MDRQTQTDHATTCVTIGRIHAMHMMWHNNDKERANLYAKLAMSNTHTYPFGTANNLLLGDGIQHVGWNFAASTACSVPWILCTQLKHNVHAYITQNSKHIGIYRHHHLFLSKLQVCHYNVSILMPLATHTEAATIGPVYCIYWNDQIIRKWQCDNW